MTTLDQYRTMLPVNKYRLDDELEIQPDIMMRIASSVTVANSRMLEAKDELAREEGELSENVKDEEPKATVTMIDSRVKRHARRIRAWQKFQDARQEYEQWNGLLEAWRQKGFSLKTLADLHAAQYFSVDSARAPRTRELSQDEARAKMRQAGQSFKVEEHQTSSTARRRVLT